MDMATRALLEVLDKLKTMTTAQYAELYESAVQEMAALESRSEVYRLTTTYVDHVVRSPGDAAESWIAPSDRPAVGDYDPPFLSRPLDRFDVSIRWQIVYKDDSERGIGIAA